MRSRNFSLYGHSLFLDVRTGLVPFTTIVTKDFQDKNNETDLNESEAINRIKNQAVVFDYLPCRCALIIFF